MARNTKVDIIPVDIIPAKPGLDPAIRTTVAIAPGLVIKRIASGKTEGSSISSCSD